MKKRKKYPTRGISEALAAAEREGTIGQVLSYKISYDPIEDKTERLPKPVKRQVETLYNMVEDDPRQAIERLLKLKQEYPKIPLLYNYLSAAYGLLGECQASRAMIIENYQENPDYLFAKINFAQLCLQEGYPSKVPDIFDNKFDLKLLYPHRNQFHVSEFAGFTAVMCAYYCLTGKRQSAELLYKSLVEIAPNYQVTVFARHFMYPSLLFRFKLWMRGKRQKHLQQIDHKLAQQTDPSSTHKDKAPFDA